MKHYARTLTLFLFTSVLVGQPTFTDHTISTSADGAYDVHAVDVDGDGDMDVLSTSHQDDKIAWYENDGSESLQSTPLPHQQMGLFMQRMWMVMGTWTWFLGLS